MNAPRPLPPRAVQQTLPLAAQSRRPAVPTPSPVPVQAVRPAPRPGAAGVGQKAPPGTSVAPIEMRKSAPAAQPAAPAARIDFTLAEIARPQWITEMSGNKKVLGDIQQRLRDNTLRRAVFTYGPTGCGKTTLNMILAKSLTCLHPGPDGKPCGTCASCAIFTDPMYRDRHPDIYVMNCSENTGIADVRQMLELARVFPMIGRHRVIFLDEAQGLSKQGEQALLKDLEHPPAHTAFLVGSMEPEKVSKAVVDRCLPVKLTTSDKTSLSARLVAIAASVGVTLEKAIADSIADFSEGIPRAAVQLLDGALIRLKSGEQVELERASEFVASVGHSSPFTLAKKALSAIYMNRPDQFVEAVSMSENPLFLLRTMITQNADMIRVAVLPSAVSNINAQRTARDIGATAAKSKIGIMQQANVGRALEETLKLTASYNVDAVSALTHTAVLLASQLFQGR